MNNNKCQYISILFKYTQFTAGYEIYQFPIIFLNSVSNYAHSSVKRRKISTLCLILIRNVIMRSPKMIKRSIRGEAIDIDPISEDDQCLSIPYSVTNNEEQDEILLEPYTYILRKKGKNIRTRLLQAFNIWLRAPDEKVGEIDEIIKMLHNASLVIDDIEDNSVLRRGNPVSHKIYGVASSINSANYVYFIGLEKVLALNKIEAVKLFKDSMLELHRGQGMEIYWRDTYMCPTENEYRETVVRKTGGLFNLAITLLQLFSDNQKCPKYDYVKLTSLLGYYFQIRDDYANLCLEQYFENKSFAEDLTEGKFSFPIVHAIQKYPRDNRLINILRQRTQEDEVKKYAIQLLEDAGSFAYTRAQMELLDQKIRNEIEKLNGNDLLTRLMDELRNWNTDLETNGTE